MTVLPRWLMKRKAICWPRIIYCIKSIHGMRKLSFMILCTTFTCLWFLFNLINIVQGQKYVHNFCKTKFYDIALHDWTSGTLFGIHVPDHIYSPKGGLSCILLNQLKMTWLGSELLNPSVWEVAYQPVCGYPVSVCWVGWCRRATHDALCGLTAAPPAWLFDLEYSVWTEHFHLNFSTPTGKDKTPPVSIPENMILQTESCAHG